MAAPLFQPTLVTFTGLYADDNIIEVQQLGRSLHGLSKLANGITQFYLNGSVIRDSRLFTVRVYTGPPQKNGVALELVAIMQSGQLPLYAPILLQMAENFLPKIWRAVVEIALNQSSNEERMLDAIIDLAQRHDEFAREVHAGHMRDKTWLQDHISQITEASRQALADTAAPVGRSCRREQVYPQDLDGVNIDEAVAQSLKSKGEIQVEEARQMTLVMHAVNVDTGSGRAEVVGEPGLLSIKITDPALAVPENVYTQSLDRQVPITATAKPTIRDGAINRLYISDARMVPNGAR